MCFYLILGYFHDIEEIDSSYCMWFFNRDTKACGSYSGGSQALGSCGGTGVYTV